jgi:hypothetical protein
VAQVSARIYGLGADELIHRLETQPEKISDNMLNAIAGTAADKKAAAEGWTARDAAQNSLDTMERFFRRLEARGVPRVSLDLGDEPERALTPKPNGSPKEGDA